MLPSSLGNSRGAPHPLDGIGNLEERTSAHFLPSSLSAFDPTCLDQRGEEKGRQKKWIEPLMNLKEKPILLG